MEIIQGLEKAIIAFLVFSALAQVVFAYALQVISEKNELPDFAAFLSWIPLLNLYPLIRCGGGSFPKFLMGFVGLIALSIGAAVLGSAVGGLVAVLAGIAVALGALFYMAVIMMNTAESRGLAGWVGLLTFIPILNFFVYPYIAFHDGFHAPHKIGAVLGLLLAFGPIPGQIKMVDTFSEAYATFQERADQLQNPTLTGAETPSLAAAFASSDAAIEIGAQLSMLEGMDPSVKAQAEMMRGELALIRSKLGTSRAALGDEAADGFSEMLRAQEARLDVWYPAATPDLGESAIASQSGFDAIVPDVAVGDRTGQHSPAVTTASTRALTAGIGRDGDRGFAVPESPGCPPATTAKGAAPPDQSRRWCEKTGPYAGIKHGWMTQWHPNGQPALAGEYQDGLRVGVWTRWHENGTKRVQAEFADGLQDGVLLAWDRAGDMVYESSFTNGGPASR